MKTLPRVASEMALHLLAYNLTRAMNRAMNIVGPDAYCCDQGLGAGALTLISMTPASPERHNKVRSVAQLKIRKIAFTTRVAELLLAVSRASFRPDTTKTLTGPSSETAHATSAKVNSAETREALLSPR